MALPLKKDIGIVVPPSIRRRAGIKPGAEVAFATSKGTITITAAPRDADGLTPQQRADLLRGLREAKAQMDRGEFYGPYASAAELKAEIEAEIRKSRKKKPKK